VPGPGCGVQQRRTGGRRGLKKGRLCVCGVGKGKPGHQRPECLARGFRPTQGALILREDWATLEGFFAALHGDKLTPDDRRTLGKAYVRTGKYEKAIDTLKPLAQTEPGNTETRALLAASYLYLDRPDEAAAEIDGVWEKVVSERRSDVMTTRGLIYSRQNDLPKAIETLNAALEIDPANGAALNALGQAYARRPHP
jgi:tetratricopeptide (TPR) repeat protein